MLGGDRSSLRLLHFPVLQLCIGAWSGHFHQCVTMTESCQQPQGCDGYEISALPPSEQGFTLETRLAARKHDTPAGMVRLEEIVLGHTATRCHPQGVIWPQTHREESVEELQEQWSRSAPPLASMQPLGHGDRRQHSFCYCPCTEPY